MEGLGPGEVPRSPPVLSPLPSPASPVPPLPLLQAMSEPRTDDNVHMLRPSFCISPTLVTTPPLAESIPPLFLASLFTSLVMTPFDVVKTRVQSQAVVAGLHSPLASAHPSLASFTPAETRARSFVGSGDGLVKIFKYEGSAGLWKGLTPTIIQSLPATTFYYLAYERLRDYLSPMYPVYAPILAGSIARASTATLVSPIELLRTRLQSGTTRTGSSLGGAWADLRAMVTREGPRSLWKGIGSTLWRDVPFSAIYWFTYEQTKSALVQWRDSSPPPSHDPPPLPSLTTGTLNNLSGQHPCSNPPTSLKNAQNDMAGPSVAFASGFVGGTLAAVLTHPFDLAKTLMQIQRASPQLQTNEPLVPSPSTFGIIADVVRREGPRGVFRGLSARIAKIGPSCAIMISTYELGKRYFGQGAE